MPLIQFGCPNCGATAQIDASMAGRQTGCPGCGSLVLVPAAPPVFGGPPPISVGPPPITGPVPPVAVAAPPLALGAPPLAVGAPPVAVGAPPVIGGPPPVTSRLAGVTYGPPPVTFAEASSMPMPMAPRPIMSAPVYGAPVAPAMPPSRPQPAMSEEKKALRKLSPEEKAQRRFRRNIISAALGIALLFVAMALLLKLSG